MRSGVRMALLVVIVACATFSVAGQSAPPPTPLRLVSADGTRTIPTVVSGDTELVAFDDLASLFNLTVREDAVARAITVGYKGKTIVLSQNQALASISGRLVSLPAPPSRVGTRWYVPVEFIGRVLSVVSDVPLQLRKASRLVILGALRVPRIVVRHDAGGNQARVTLDVTPRTPHQVQQEATRLLIRFEADLLDVTISPFQPQGIVQAIHVGEVPTTLAIDLGPRFGSLRASDAPVDPDGTRVTIDLFATPDQTASPTAPRPAAPVAPEPIFPAPGVKTIVIDPGHGGDEHGAKGAKGTLEKAVTLSVARRLKALIESRLGARVLLTRDDDRAVGPDERASLANNNKADLFLSLHVNASLRKAASGAQVFYLSLDRADEEARRVAESEGVAMPVFGGGTREIDVILWEMAQAQYLDQSAVLARAIEQEMRAVVPMSPRPIQKAPFRVLVGANMPAVLVEMGYLTNASQEAQLLGGEFQARIAQALTNAVSRFFANAPSPPPQAATTPAPSTGRAPR
jgi:N-acetylmuramoyl-L-alanine amidase